jgi:glycerate 2-kinase
LSPPNPHLQPRAFLHALFQQAVNAAMPAHVLADQLPAVPRGRTLVLGAGKASAAMAQALEQLWPTSAPLSGLVVTRYGHIPPRPAAAGGRIQIVEAAHPVPDAAGQSAAQTMLQLCRGLSADDLVLCLISGGGSALLTLPARDADGQPLLSLTDKQNINQGLLASGATIAEINCVRKHLSALKGGRLAQACAPAPIVNLLISDVPGDDPSVIASGPTVADASSCPDALAVLERYGIAVPAAVQRALLNGELETPKPDAPRFQHVRTELIATPWKSLQTAAEWARRAGIAAHVLSDAIEGEAREVGKVHGAWARAVALRGQPFSPPCVLLSGGETTVSMGQRAGEGSGRGGRSGEFALGLLQALQGQPGIHALAADTDGIDGVEDNAGVFLGPDTWSRAQSLGLSLDDYQRRHDSYGFFSALDELLVTGPTHTNVNDFRAILIT